MLIIDKQTRGRHGNKVFHFNTLMQLGEMLGQEVYTVSWEGYDSFQETCEVLLSPTHTEEIPYTDLIYCSHEELKEKYGTGNWRLHPLSLCGPFYRLTNKDPREFLALKRRYLAEIDKICVGIHIRGGDTRGADGMNCREVHPPTYYIKAIDYVLEQCGGDVVFFVCTDDPDPNYPSYKETMDHLLSRKVQLYHDLQNHYMKDFSILTECDILIAGSSTFVLAAAMLGNDKKVIHSKKFVEQFKEEDQTWYSNFGNGMFFHDMNHIKSPYYDVWKLL